MVGKPVAVAGHIDDLAAVDESVEDGSGDGGITEEVGPLIVQWSPCQDQERKIYREPGISKQL